MNPNEQQRRRGPGNKIPAIPNLKKNMIDDNEEETTRRIRIGGGRAAPNFGMASMGGGHGMAFDPSIQMPGPTLNTVTSKAAAVMSDPVESLWNVSTVPTLPEFHPVERTAVFVANTSAQVLAGRISSVLRNRSIEASFDENEAKAKCITSEGVEFRIKLYRGRGSYSNGIIVEVQRRFGNALNFHHDQKAILDAAEGKLTSQLGKASSSDLPRVESDSEDEDYVPPSSGASSLKIVSKMLKIPGFDGQYLGLQTLSTMVNPEKMTPQTARKVAQELLKVDSEVGAKVLSYIISRKTVDEGYKELRVMSLDVLKNSMKATGMIPEFIRGSIRASLLQDINAAEEHTRAACCALGVMEYFARGDEDTMELNDAFEFARSVGEKRHMDLMRQAERCIAAIR